MATLGNVPAEAYTNTVKDSFSGNGSATAFTMSLPTVTNDVRVVVENVIQDPTVAYSVSGTTLTFTSAPPSGTNNVYVVHLGPAVMTTVPPAEIADATTFASSLTVQGAFTSQGIDDNGNATAMTITSDEDVLIGKTSSSYNTVGSELLNNGAYKGLGQFTTDGINTLTLNRKSSDGEIAIFRKDGTSVGSIGTVSGTLYIGSPNGSDAFAKFNNNSITPSTSAGAARDNAIDLGASSARFKDAYLSGGIYLGGAVAANKLDDYETGSWTPAFSGASTNTGASNSGTYVKIGVLVHCTFNITQSALTGTSIATMTGLPFNCADVSNVNAFSIQDCGHTLNTVSSDNGRFRCVPLNATLQGVKSLGSTTYMTYNEFYDGSGSLEIKGHFTYRSA